MATPCQTHEDLILKYRPRRLDQFWNQKGTVSEVRRMLERRMMFKGQIYAGAKGTGKTSLARTLPYAVQCENPDGVEPCLGCTNCGLGLSSGYIGFTANLIDGPSFTRDELDHVMKLDLYPPWNDYGILFCIIDEAHRINRNEQERFLHVIEDTISTHFIFCTTNPEKIIDAIHARCHLFSMNLPSVDEAKAGLSRIATAEGIEIPASVMAAIVHQRNRNPRECVKDLQFYRTLGRLPDYPQDEMPIA